MSLKTAKILGVIVVFCSITYISWCGFGINYGVKPGILLAASTTTTKESQSAATPNPKTSATTKSTVKNSGSQPDMPLMPVMPTNPAASTTTKNTSSVLKRPWESGQDQTKSGQLKTQWENRRSKLLSGKSLKIKNSIEKNKDKIHQKSKGKSSKTEVKPAGN